MKNIPPFIQTILDAVPACIYWKDTEGRYLGYNAFTVEKMKTVGLNANLIGKTDFDIFTREVARNYREIDRKVIDERTTLCIEEPVVLPNKQQLVQLSTKKPLLNEENVVIGVICITIDVTERKKLETNLKIALEKSEAANQAKTEFLENMRHDIRTPLSGIVGCAELLLSKTHDSTISNYVNDLVESSNALLDFLNNILEGIQVATGEIPLVKKKFDLRKQLEEIINLNKSLAAEKKLTLNLNYDKTIPLYLIGDPVRVQRIVLELLSNALMFTKQGEVNLIVKQKGKKDDRIILEITVSDTGIGIPKDKQEEIFIRFKRLTPSYKGIYKGLGLGLTTVKQFVDDLDGEIYVTSDIEKGSTFTCLIAFKEPMVVDETGIIEEAPLPKYVKFNKKAAVATTLVAQTPSEIDAVKSKVLLVEDNILAAKAATNILSNLNCTIDIAPDGKTAMELLKKHVYQLVLMDIGLPDTDGVALTHRIRLEQWQKNHATVPIIGLTAHIEGERKQQCLNAGMNAVILKPLKKEAAQELLTTFAQSDSREAPSSDNMAIKGPVLDFDEIKQTLQNDDLIEECRKLMVEGLADDLTKLGNWYPVEDWESIQSIAHKWQGGAVYYGAKRLEQACKNFNGYWASGQREQMVFKTLYQHLVQEMEAVIEVCHHKQ